MKRTNFILLLLFIALLPIVAKSYSFLQLNNTNGLSNNQVEVIFQDSRGFMWFATNSGLNRYDGHNFKIYKTDSRKKNTLSSDKITSIQEDALGNLWFLNRMPRYDVYCLNSEKIIQNTDSILNTYGLPPTPDLIKIFNKKELFAYYRNGDLFCYNFETKNNRKIISDGHLKGAIQDMAISDKYTWLLFNDGVLKCIDITNGSVDFKDDYFNKQAYTSTINKNIVIDNDGDLWVYPGIADKGIAYLNIKNKKWSFLDQESTKMLSTNFVRCIAQDQNHLFWIGTDHGGINIYDKQQNKVINTIRNDIYDDSSIGQNSIISTFCSEDGTIWIGTYKNGISYYNPNISKFDKAQLFYHFRDHTKTFDCNSFYKDNDGYLWIGTNGEGLIKYNEKQNIPIFFKHDPLNKQSISSDIITSLTIDHRNILWIGTFLGGINAYDGNSFKRYQIDEKDTNSISSRSVYGIAEDAKNNLWIATLGGGIDRLDNNRSSFTRYTSSANSQLRSNYIVSIFKNDNSEIYFGSDQGPYVLKDNQIVPSLSEEVLRDSLSSIKCNNLISDRRDILWIATDNGINIFDKKTNKTLIINNKDGLPDEEVVSLIEDNFGNIWAGTRNGLIYVECTYLDNELNYNIFYFDSKDGLPSSVCNQNAIYKDTNGKIYVGTTKGYVSFYPNKIKMNNVPPKPRFTDLIIAGQTINPNEEYRNRIILDKSITNLDQIILKYDETNFSITFSALNYIHSEKNEYKYQLEGLDKEWITTPKGQGIASYSNLNPGKYKLKVYASNEDGVWSEQAIILDIIVTPPFWLSWWAYLIYIIIILFIIWAISKYKLNKQKTEFKQKQKVLEIQKRHEIDELKFKFFTNISHEFKTPITLILAPLDQLLKTEIEGDNHKLLVIIRKNALNLLTMVNEILEFRKLDVNKADIILTQNDIISFTKEICNSFSPLANQKGINFSFTSYFECLEVNFDYEKMKKILVNLISNAFKYTEDGDININIGINESIDTSEKKLLIKISDTGIGIEKNYQSKIFDRFYRIENNQKNIANGTGVGLHIASEYIKMHGGEIILESEIGKGSIFTIVLPIDSSTNTNRLDSSINNVFLEAISEKDIEVIDNVDIPNRANLPILMIVDDNEDLRTFVSDMFSDSYNVITAEDGCEAMSQIMDQLPDIILCDVMMPKMDGYELCKNLRKDLRTSHIPIILISAKSSDESKYLGIEAGADDYIEKPFNIDLLRLKITRIIEKQRKIQQTFKQKIEISPSKVEITSMDEKFVKKAVEVVELNISNADFLVEDLCKEMAMSRVYFYKKILALTGKTPSEFIRFIRLKRAAELLKKSQMFVNEVAYQVGFNDAKYFRKYFKDEFDLTPNEYKKKYTSE